MRPNVVVFEQTHHYMHQRKLIWELKTLAVKDFTNAEPDNKELSILLHFKV